MRSTLGCGPSVSYGNAGYIFISMIHGVLADLSYELRSLSALCWALRTGAWCGTSIIILGPLDQPKVIPEQLIVQLRGFN